MLEKMKRLVVDEEGQALSEYGLIIALVAIALIAALGFLKDDIAKVFEKIGDALNPPAAS
ncbi:Flp family type IVb pilin [Neobacillus sp. LXY-4]|uniref:Flp family type IVb pilin n=1 Tax=Neobacillus sp. LXY-4 TaxID=3379826 RepID=UPI003EE3D068